MALLDGLEISEIPYYRIVNDKRFDPEFYGKEYLARESVLASLNSQSLGNICKLYDGPFGSEFHANDYAKQGVPLLRMQNISKDGSLRLDDVQFVSADDAKELTDYQALPGDVVVTKIGFLGYSTVLTKECEKYIFRRELTKCEIVDLSINRYYLASFFNSKYGRSQFYRYSSGTTRDRVLLTSQKAILVPSFSSQFYNLIQACLERAYTKLSSSKTRFADAEFSLLDNLGLNNWLPPTENTAIKSFKESFSDTGRLDAEYYQPKYDELKEIINRNATSILRVKSIATFNQRGDQPDYVEDGELSIINSRHILEQHLDYGNFERTDAGKWDEFPLARVFKNDILIYTTGANVGRANIYLSDARALASNHVNILRIENANPVYVAFVLNSLVGRMQTKQIVTGSAQAELYPGAIEQFLVPFVSDEAQKTIVKAVEESYILKEQSKRLLETAQRAVEIAIEQNEDAAMEYIGQN